MLTPEQLAAVRQAVEEYLADQQETGDQFIGNAYANGRGGVADIAGAEVVKDTLEGARIASLQDANFDLIVSVANKWVDDIQSLVGDSYLAGESPVDIAGHLSTYFERMPGNWSTIARDQVAKAQLAGRNATYDQIGQEKVEVTLAPDACGVCKPHNRNIVLVTDSAHRPQFHIQCACMDVPVVDDEATEATSADELARDDDQSRQGGHQ